MDALATAAPTTIASNHNISTTIQAGHFCVQIIYVVTKKSNCFNKTVFSFLCFDVMFGEKGFSDLFMY